MSLVTDLDDWTDDLGTALGLDATRDPAKVNPGGADDKPCLFVQLPEVEAFTLPMITAIIPVYLVAAGAGKQAGDQLLTYLPDVLVALERKAATPETLNIDGVDFHAYLIPARLYITP
jgi:hypothetical protein